MKTSKQPAKSAKDEKVPSLSHDPPRYKITMCNGVPVLPSRGEVITVEHIQKIMDEEGI